MATWFEGLTAGKLDSKIRDSFLMFDLDEGGTLDKDEFTKAFAFMGKRLTSEEVDILFHEFDMDAGGSISLDEFSHKIKTFVKQPCRKGCVPCAQISFRPERTEGFTLNEPHKDLWHPAAQRVQAVVSMRLNQLELQKITVSALVLQSVMRGMRARKPVRVARNKKAEWYRRVKALLVLVPALASFDENEVEQRTACCFLHIHSCCLASVYDDILPFMTIYYNSAKPYPHMRMKLCCISVFSRLMYHSIIRADCEDLQALQGAHVREE